MVSAIKGRPAHPSGAQITEDLATRTKSDPLFWPDHAVTAEIPRWVLSGTRSVMQSFDGHPMMVTEWRVKNPRATLVLFQGRAESAFRWEEPARVFNRAGIDVITLDWPGQGMSGRFADGNAHHGDVRELVTHGRHFIEALEREGKLTPPVTVQGYSMGGCIAAALAVDPPKSVDRVILHQPMTDFHPKSVTDASPTLGRLLQLGIRPYVLAGLTGSALCLTNPSLRTAPTWGTERDLLRYFDDGPWLSTKDGRRRDRERRAAHALPSMNVSGFTWDATVSAAKLIGEVMWNANRIELSTLIVSGEDDRVVCNDSHERIHQLIENSERVLIPDTGHAAHVCEKPARRAYFDAVVPFILSCGNA